MEKYFSVLQLTYFDNSIGDYLLFGLFLFIGVVFKRYFSKLSTRLLFEVFKKHALGLTRNDFYVLIKKPISSLILLIFVFLAFSNLEYPSVLNLVSKEHFGLKMIIEKLFFTLFILTFINIFRKMLDFLGIIMYKKAEEKEKNAEKQIISFVIESLKLGVLIIGIFVLLGSVFNINVGTLIAGLGIGGLAVALAAKESIENLMGSFTIFADKPFVTGDLVKVGNTQGVVEKVGFRSTRLRTLDKTFVTVPNKMMIDTEVDNFTERKTRRITFNIGLRYDTSIEQMKQVMNDIEEYITEHPETIEDCHIKFAEFGESSLNIMVLYFIDGNDFQKFLDVRENINFKIMEIVHKHNCDFAFPSRSVYMEGK